MQDNFFSNFQAVSAEEWQQQIEKDLKGKPYEGLLKSTREGIQIQPNYTNANSIEDAPGTPPYIRGHKVAPEAWTIAEFLSSTDDNKTILEALNAGVNGLLLEATGSIKAQLKGVELPYVSFYLRNTHSLDQTQTILKLIKERGYEPSSVQGSLGLDPLGNGLLAGEWKENHTDIIRDAFMLSTSYDGLANVRFFDVNANNYTNAGASAATELGMALAQGHEYLVAGLNEGMSIDHVSAKIQFNLGIATDYFVELTKFRVLRRLWSRVIGVYQPEHSCSHSTYILGETSQRYFSAADVHSNMIRTTTMVMSAALGGADAIHAIPFDIHLKEAGSFSKRIARNVNLILQEESYLHRVLDPAGGSYFLDELATDLCDKAWAIFQEIEAKGGFTKAVETGWIQNTISLEADEQLRELNDHERIMVGVNKFENQLDDLSTASFSTLIEGKDFAPLNIIRLSETFEKDRV
jgi:methylmalonyl-CoA mutase